MSGNRGTSAYVGQPPHNQRDYYIVRGLLRTLGLYHVDPSLGYTLAAQKPSDVYTYASKQPGIIAGLIIIIIAITLATGARLILRASTSRMQFGTDDWATIAAAAFGMTYAVGQLIMALHGGGHHIWEATYDDYNIFNYWGVLDKLFFYLCVSFNKVSLTLFIRRLADRSSRKWRIFCDVYLATIVLYILLAIFWTLFSCNPAQSQWDKWYNGTLAMPATCIDLIVQNRVLNIMHIVQGFILLLSPMAILWTVRINKARKTRLFGIWGVGAIVVLCGLMRFIRTDFTSDIMWNYTELLIWTSLDVCIGVIVISLPVMDAWMADAWHGAVTKLGRGSRGGTRRASGSTGKRKSYYGNGNSNNGYANGSGVRSLFRVASPRKHSDSADEIIGEDGGFEMNIVRTDEYNVRFSSASPGSSSERDSDYYEMPEKAYSKHKGVGIAV